MNLLYKLALPAAIFFSLPAFAQFNPGLKRYHEYMNMATLANAAGAKDSAIVHYKNALDASRDYKPPFYDLGNLLIGKGNYAEGISYLTEEVRSSIDEQKFEYLFENYDSVKTRPQIVAFQKRFPTLLAQRKPAIVSREWERLVCKMTGLDQAMRSSYSVAGTDSGLVSSDGILRLQCHADTALVRPLLMEYLRSNNFPDIDSMDGDLGQAFNIIILHQLDYSDAEALVLDSMVRNAVYDGRFSPFQYAMTMDRRHMIRNRKQLYGTYMERKQDGSWAFSPEIDRLETVDARRAQWGLLPLKDMGKTDWRNPPMPEGYRH